MTMTAGRAKTTGVTLPWGGGLFFAAALGLSLSADPIDTATLEREMVHAVKRIPELQEAFRAAEKEGVELLLYGGTTRSLAFHVKQELERKGQALLSEKTPLSLEDVIGPYSDLDLVVRGPAEKAARIERQLREKFPPGERFYRWEVRPESFLKERWQITQGYEPISKILLGKEGFKELDWRRGTFGKSLTEQGVDEVLSGEISYVRNPRYKESEPFRRRQHHEVLEALRFLRFSHEFPDARPAPGSLPRVQDILEGAADHSEQFQQFLKNDLFQHRFSTNLTKLYSTPFDNRELVATLRRVGFPQFLRAAGLEKHLLEPLPASSGGVAPKHQAIPAEVKTVYHKTRDYRSAWSIARGGFYISKQGLEFANLDQSTHSSGAAYGRGVYAAEKRNFRGSERDVGLEIELSEAGRQGVGIRKVGEDVYLITSREAIGKIHWETPARLRERLERALATAPNHPERLPEVRHELLGILANSREPQVTWKAANFLLKNGEQSDAFLDLVVGRLASWETISTEKGALAASLYPPLADQLSRRLESFSDDAVEAFLRNAQRAKVPVKSLQNLGRRIMETPPHDLPVYDLLADMRFSHPDLKMATRLAQLLLGGEPAWRVGEAMEKLPAERAAALRGSLWKGIESAYDEILRESVSDWSRVQRFHPALELFLKWTPPEEIPPRLRKDFYEMATQEKQPRPPAIRWFTEAPVSPAEAAELRKAIWRIFDSRMPYGTTPYDEEVLEKGLIRFGETSARFEKRLIRKVTQWGEEVHGEILREHAERTGRTEEIRNLLYQKWYRKHRGMRSHHDEGPILKTLYLLGERRPEFVQSVLDWTRAHDPKAIEVARLMPEAEATQALLDASLKPDDPAGPGKQFQNELRKTALEALRDRVSPEILQQVERAARGGSYNPEYRKNLRAFARQVRPNVTAQVASVPNPPSRPMTQELGLVAVQSQRSEVQSPESRLDTTVSPHPFSGPVWSTVARETKSFGKGMGIWMGALALSDAAKSIGSGKWKDIPGQLGAMVRPESLGALGLNYGSFSAAARAVEQPMLWMASKGSAQALRSVARFAGPLGFFAGSAVADWVTSGHLDLERWLVSGAGFLGSHALLNATVAPLIVTGLGLSSTGIGATVGVPILILAGSMLASSAVEYGYFWLKDYFQKHPEVFEQQNQPPHVDRQGAGKEISSTGGGVAGALDRAAEAMGVADHGSP